MKTILAIFAHPDDEVGCAGTLARHSARGDRVVLAWLTRGGLTEIYGDLPVEEVERRRTAQGLRAAEILGCEPRFFDLPDTAVERTRESVVMVARLIAEVRPDAILTWGDAWVRGMRHPDHQATSAIVRDAITLARLSRVVTPLSPHRGDAPLFTLRDQHSTLPARAVDVTPVRAQIEELAQHYREAVGWPPEDWLSQSLESSGAEWGVSLAEVFDAWESEPGIGEGLL